MKPGSYKLAAGLALLSIGTALVSQAKPAPAYRIQGIVLNAQDSSPLRRCHMAASLVTGRPEAAEAIRTDTDEQGRFSLDVPSPGNWQLTATAYNIRPQQLDEHEGYFSGVILTSGSPVYDVVFRAVPDAVLTGTVTDEAGEAVRNAQVALYIVNPAARQTGSPTMQMRSGAQTDDRGRYELASLEPGQYMVRVVAQPWYTSTLTHQARTAASTSASPPPDPSLDVVYPPTWYPGVTDSVAAGTLTARAGDRLQADFRLQPVASAHLLIPSPQPSPPPDRPGERLGPPRSANPNIAMVMPDGTTQPIFGQIARNEAGDLDVGGLAPGTYQVSLPGLGPDTPLRTATIRVQAGGSIELGASAPTTAVTIEVDGGTGSGPRQIMLRSVATGQVFSDFNRPEGGPRPVALQGSGSARRLDGSRTTAQPRGPAAGQRGTQARQPAGPGAPRRGRASSDSESVTIQVPPGIYEVVLPGGSPNFITGITATGTTASGRKMAVGDLPVHLVAHLATGFVTVGGTALLAGKPSVGAMVLLVPATLGDPASLTVVQRDQTNTDGSFRIENVVPGQYILLAIDHGWAVRWSDPETLRPYLMRGLPLDLHSSGATGLRLTAVSP